MSEVKLKLVTQGSTESIYIVQREKEDPVLAYKEGNEIILLNKGGAPGSRLLDCKTLYDILSKYFIKGTKFIISTYNPVLYYLFPGDSTYDKMFNPSTNFVPTLKINSLIRGEVNGFDSTEVSKISADQTKSVKACDTWQNNPAEEERAVEAVNERIRLVFGFYKDFTDLDLEKEVREKIGPYSVDLSENSMTVDLISGTLYTDTISLEDWAYCSGMSGNLEAKLDISFMYSIGDNMYGGSQTIEAFKYSDSILVVRDYIINLGNVQLEYIGKVLKIYPVNPDISEVVFNDACLTIGV